MDTSKEYIKMCEKAVEIQEIAEQDVHNTYFKCQPYDDYPQIYKNEFDDRVWYMERWRVGYWLPRQDQLQEIYWDWNCEKRGVNIYSGDEKLRALIYRSEKFATSVDFAYKSSPTMGHGWGSMEQLWLAFVMKEKYGKWWTGTEWKESDA